MLKSLRAAVSAMLVKSRTTEPRRFGNPTSALIVLRDVGIDVIQIDATDWNPDQKDMSRSRQNRADAMREAHEAAAYNQWLAAEIQELYDDPPVKHSVDEVMAQMDARIARHMAANEKRPG